MMVIQVMIIKLRVYGCRLRGVPAMPVHAVLSTPIIMMLYLKIGAASQP